MSDVKTADSYAEAAEMGRRARSLLIDLTHKLPKTASQDVLRMWNEVDTALLAFLRRMDDER